MRMGARGPGEEAPAKDDCSLQKCSSKGLSQSRYSDLPVGDSTCSKR